MQTFPGPRIEAAERTVCCPVCCSPPSVLFVVWTLSHKTSGRSPRKELRDHVLLVHLLSSFLCLCLEAERVSHLQPDQRHCCLNPDFIYSAQEIYRKYSVTKWECHMAIIHSAGINKLPLAAIYHSVYHTASSGCYNWRHKNLEWAQYSEE